MVINIQFAVHVITLIIHVDIHCICMYIPLLLICCICFFLGKDDVCKFAKFLSVSPRQIKEDILDKERTVLEEQLKSISSDEVSSLQCTMYNV